jgi:hypothetical protein
MAFPKAAKPATAETVNRLRECDQLGGSITSEATHNQNRLQVHYLLARFALTERQARLVAEHAFFVGVPR